MGEYENILFLEAARMLKHEAPKDVAIVMLSYLPIPGNIGEMKTKPTQHASRELKLRGFAGRYHFGARRGASGPETQRKNSALLQRLPERVVSAPDVESIYDVPLNYEKDGLGDTICDVLGLERRKSDLTDWAAYVAKSKNGSKTVKVAVVGKYFKSGEYVLADVYISVIEAIKAAAYHQELKPEISYIDSNDFESGALSLEELRKYDGIIVPAASASAG